MPVVNTREYSVKCKKTVINPLKLKFGCVADITFSRELYDKINKATKSENIFYEKLVKLYDRFWMSLSFGRCFECNYDARNAYFGNI
jgi:hypothetical protein